MEMQVPRIRERFMTKIVGALRKVLPPDSGANSDERLRAWPCEAEPAEIVAALGLDGRDAETDKAALDSIRLISQPAGTLDEAVELVVASYLAAPNAQTRENVVRQITEALKGPYSQPPGDALFLAHEHHPGFSWRQP